MSRQVGATVLGQSEASCVQIYLELGRVDIFRYGENMNFEGQNINLQDALFVDNITGDRCTGTLHIIEIIKQFFDKHY